MSKPYIVDGMSRFDGWFIVTDRLVFKSGSQLVFTPQALERRRNLYIVAKEVVSEDANAPGTITYERPPASVGDAKPGQAPTGAHAALDGHPGLPGGGGDPGAAGAAGFAAPSITITTLAVPSSGPVVDFRGGEGGKGGQGQRGGDGGVGAKGSPASASLFGCKAGGGRGGDGGAGGVGGAGGPGGRGGPGGTVTIIAPSGLLPSLSQKFRVLTSAGGPGQPGEPGSGGRGGPGGPGGQEAKPFCGGGDSGGPGAPGVGGTAGGGGMPGVDGDFLVGAITPETFAVVFR